jgi:pimeloyl-ACP methyl ester carboxylesterase
MRSSVRHLSVALLALTTLGAGQAPTAPAPGRPTPGTSTVAGIIHGNRLGSEIVSLTHDTDGWRISSTGHQSPPLDVQTNRFVVTYADDWQPRRLDLEAIVRGQPISMITTIAGTMATNQVTGPARTATSTHKVSARTVILPNSFYGGYEALAARLSTMAEGDQVPIYVAPDGEIPAVVAKVTPRIITTLHGRSTYREFDLTISGGTAAPIQVWVDDQNRLARLTLTGSDLTVARDDLATVMAREEVVRNAGDANAFIPLTDFSVAASITSPSTATAKRPVVVLVPGFGPQDREMVVSDVPVFGLLAGWLADEGYLVVRYDPRGIGQSGGRPESAALAQYADDLGGVIDWLRRRKDVDSDRIAVIGFGDGSGAIAMLAASKSNRIRALGLVAVPGVTGRDFVVEQQARALAALQLSDADRQAKIALQQKIMNAAISGNGWDDVPAALRRGADQPIYKSWLLFDPATVVPKIEQPIQRNKN